MSDHGGCASGGDRWGPGWGRVLAAVGAAMLLAALVGCGDGDEADGAEDEPEGSAGPVVNEDHWHAAFGVYVCDEFLPAIPDSPSAPGIHTHGDGVIHIHPFTAEAAGENATLSVFLDGAGIDVSDDELTVGGETYTPGEDTCGEDEVGEITLVRWADVATTDAEPEPVDVDARFRQDGEGYVIAFVSDGTDITDIPKPESAAQLDELGAIDSAGGVGALPTTTRPDDVGGDESPTGVTDDRSLADGFYEVERTEPVPCRTPGTRADMTNESCYLLPDVPALETDVIEEAEASLAQTGGWQVDLLLTEGGIDAFNVVAARCSPPSSTCPLGQLALVVDDEIVTAPTLQQPSFERDQIVVTGNLTEDDARSIADALAG